MARRKRERISELEPVSGGRAGESILGEEVSSLEESVVSAARELPEMDDGPTASGCGGKYFLNPTDVEFTSSGCTLLDLTLGGGWGCGRIVNIVGDRSTGKTLLAIEAIANFASRFKDGRIWYREAEAAFDKSYAAALGMPLDRVSFSGANALVTVEDVFEDLKACVKDTDASTPGMYVLDSLDALSDKAEMERGISDGTYGAAKAKKLSELFRRLVRDIEAHKITVVIISQVRDNINPGFGGKAYSRSGGRSLDFYASQVIYLAQTGKIYRTIKKEKRSVGVNIKARCEKNKVGLPYRECEFPIYFAYGTENLLANCAYLERVERLDRAGITESDMKKLPKAVLEMSQEEYLPLLEKTNELVRQHWIEVETGFLPKRKKYA